MKNSFKTYIIAEIGSNHNNNIETAFKYIKEAKKSGANAVKFQSLKKEKLISPYIFKNNKRYKNLSYEKFINLEISDEMHYKLKKFSDKIGIEFISTPFDLEAVDLLEKIGVKKYKIASGDITFYPLLTKIAKTKKSVIISTGASNIKDISNALECFKKKSNISLLHCVSNYPPKWEQMNLLAIKTLINKFNLPVGISDHSPGDMVSVASVALGATIIEKHITFDRSLKGPDHSFAMLIKEFSSMIKKIRNLELSLGDGIKKPTKEEILRQKNIRRSIYDMQHKNSSKTKGIWLRPQNK